MRERSFARRRFETPGRAFAVLLLAGCGGGGGSGGAAPSQPTRTLPITFEYRAATALDPRVSFVGCVPGGTPVVTHLHFIWIDWEDRRSMLAVGSDRFTYTDEVPAGRDLTIALHDPNSCLSGDIYVAPTTLYADGVLLTRRVDVQQGKGLAFRHEADGTITP